jgi:hypothetical protein
MSLKQFLNMFNTRWVLSILYARHIRIHTITGLRKKFCKNLTCSPGEGSWPKDWLGSLYLGQHNDHEDLGCVPFPCSLLAAGMDCNCSLLPSWSIIKPKDSIIGNDSIHHKINLQGLSMHIRRFSEMDDPNIKHLTSSGISNDISIKIPHRLY